MYLRAIFLCGFVVAGVAQSPARAQSIDGAYVAAGTECNDTFVKSKSGVSFAKRVDAFAPAMIIKDKKLYTPLAVCRLKRVSGKGELRELELECANSVSYTSITAYFRRGEKGALVRQATGTGRDGDHYEKCDL